MSNPTTKAAREAAQAKAETAFVFHPENQARAMIRTRYLQPTGSRPERVKAYARSGRKGEPSMVLPWSYDLDSQGNHARAAAALALSLGWVKEGGRKVLCGGNGDDGTAAFVIIDTAAAAPAGQRNDARGGWAV
jgi:hypothetical protein